MTSTKRTKRAARRLYRLCLVEGSLDGGRVRLVAERLSGSGRRGALPVLSSFQRLVRLDRDRHQATVESAAPLAAAERQRIQTGLTHLYGAALETSFAENPALIGGVRIRVGSDVYDGSIRAKLDALEARL
jgi:F-type H+-transporting ATPase subunit delta